MPVSVLVHPEQPSKLPLRLRLGLRHSSCDRSLVPTRSTPVRSKIEGKQVHTLNRDTNIIKTRQNRDRQSFTWVVRYISFINIICISIVIYIY